MTRPLPLLSVLLLSACHLRFHDDVRVDGVRLPAHHEQVLVLEEWPAEGLEIRVHQGDIRVESGTGPTTLTVLLHEREEGQAHAHFLDGELLARAADGATCALGRVTIRTGGPAQTLRLATGMGDVRLEGVRVEGDLRLETGMGNVIVRSAGEPRTIAITTGMGDVEVTHLRCERIEASTGMGDVGVDGLESTQAVFSSGMGDVDVKRSKGERIKAGSGLGDVELVESSFGVRELDTGLGRVRER